MLSATKEELLYLADQQAYARSRYHEDDADLIRESLVIEQALRLSAQQREPVVRVKELEWQNCIPRAWFAQTDILTYRIYETVDGAMWFLEGGAERLHADTFDAAQSAAQADYEQRIRAAIEIAPQSDRQPLPSQKQVSETGKELPKNTEQPMNNAAVSVGELAGFFATEFPHLLTMLTQIEVARSLLARYRIGRRG